MFKKFFYFIFFLIFGYFLYVYSDFYYFLEKHENINFAGEKLPEDKKQKLNDFYRSPSNILYYIIYLKNDYTINYIESQLKNKNLPSDLRLIPVIESKMQDMVSSDKGAVGIWQFIEETGKDFGLVIDENIDERHNSEKSTEAAIKYLNYIYKRFNNWTLTLASYNRGENAIGKALEKQGVKNFYDLELNKETQNYIYKILALKYIIEWGNIQKQKMEKFDF